MGIRSCLAVVAGAIVLLSTQVWAQQAPKPATGLLLGRVVEATTNVPIRDATVQIAVSGGEVDMLHHAPTGDAQPLGVLTDGEGQFVFTGLSAGTYRLFARRQGYKEALFGARRPNDSGEPIVLRPGEQRGDIVLRLWKYAAITGVVTDEFGDPIVQASVRAHAREIVAGHSRLGTAVAYARTDDRGMYRLAELLPGEYIVGIIRSERSAPAALVDAQQAAQAGARRAEADTISEAIRSAGAYVAPLGTSDSMRRGSAIIGLGPPVAPASADGWMTYATQFFPGVPGTAAARAIPVRAGQEVAGIDFQLRPVRTRSIAGIVSDANGPVARFPLRLLPASGSEFAMEDHNPAHATLTDDAGRFVFVAVPPGEYVVRALRGVGGREDFGAAAVESAAVLISSGDFAVLSAEAPPPPKAEPTRYAMVPVNVTDRDVSNVTITLAKGAPVSGAIEFSGRSDRATTNELQAIGIVIEAVDGRISGLDFEMMGSVDREGRFETVGLPAGRYFVRVPRLPPGWSLESVLLGGRDISDVPVDVGSAPISGVSIRLTREPAVLAGSVRASRATDDLGRAMVVVFPVDRTKWRDYGSAPRRLRYAVLNTAGGFEISGLPPGEYFAAAIPDDFIRDWRSPSLLDALTQSAARITIAAGARVTQTLTLTAPPGGR